MAFKAIILTKILYYQTIFCQLGKFVDRIRCYQVIENFNSWVLAVYFYSLGSQQINHCSSP